jgi:hypothetical protein
MLLSSEQTKPQRALSKRARRRRKRKAQAINASIIASTVGFPLQHFFTQAQATPGNVAGLLDLGRFD